MLKVVPRRGGVLIYQCRLCGKQDRSTHVPDIIAGMAYLNIEGRTPKEWGMVARMTTVHACRPGVTGVGELIGAEQDPAIAGDDQTSEVSS